MKKFYFLFSLILNSYVFSQTTFEAKTIQEVNTFNGGNLIRSSFDELGNHYVLGVANGQFQIDGQSITTNNDDIFISKTKSGNFEKDWLKIFRSSKGTNFLNLQMYNDQYNNTFIYLSYIGKITIDNQTYDSVENGSSILINLDTNAHVLWVKNFSPNFTITKETAVSTENYIYIVSANKYFVKLNRTTGEILEEKTLQINVSLLKSIENTIYASSINSGTAIFEGQEFNNDIYILSLDQEFKLKNTLKIKKNPTDTSFGELKFNDFLVDNNKNLTFLIVTAANAFNIYGNNQLLKTIQNDKYGSKVCLGKVNSDFTNIEWFSDNDVDKVFYNNLDKPSLIEKDANNFYAKIPFDGPYKIKINGTNYSFNNRSLIEFNNENVYQATHYYPNYYLPSYKNINGTEYITTSNHSDYFTEPAIITKENTDFDKTVKTYTIQSKKGYIENGETLLKKNNSYFVSSDGTGNFINYFGIELDQTNRSTQLAKINQNKQLEWYISMDNTTNYREENQNSNAPTSNRIDVNDAEESIVAAQCFNFDGSSLVQNCFLKGTKFNSLWYFRDKILIFKITKDGFLSWQKEIVPEKRNASINNIFNLSTIYDKLGNIWVSGYGFGKFSYDGHTFDLGGGNNPYNLFVLKINPNGDFQFLKKFPYHIDSKIFIEFDNQNIANLVLNARSNDSSFTFDNFSVAADKSTPQTLKISMNPNGTITSLKNLSPLQNVWWSTVPHVVLDTKLVNDGQLLFGYTEESITLDNQTFTNPYKANAKYANIISKIDKNGNILWSKPILPKTPTRNLTKGKIIEADSKSNIYLSHAWLHKIKYGDTEIESSSINFLENTILKLDKDSNLISYKKLGSHDNVFNINIDTEDKITLSGNTFQNNISDAIVDNRSYSNLVLLALEEKQLGTTESIENNSIIVYPNPTTDFINIKDNKYYNEAKVYDTSAKLVLNQNIKKNKIDVKSLPKGIYYLELIGKEKAVVKFIKD